MAMTFGHHPHNMKLLMKVITFLILPLTIFAKTALWFDYDLAFGKKIRDPDDAYALIHLINHQDKLDIKGLSTVYGNINDLEHQKKWSLKLLKNFNQDHLKVYQGAKSSQELGSYNQAIYQMIKVLKNQKITIIASGRLTNIASLILLRPDLISQIQEIVLLGGKRLEYEVVFGKKRILFPDTNIDGDPEAVRAIMNSYIPITMIPVESMTHLLWSKKHLEFMKEKLKGPYRWVAKKTKIWKSLWRIWPGSKGFIPWDLFLISYFTHREDFTCLKDIPYDFLYLPNRTHSLFRKRNRKPMKYFLVSSPLLESRHRANYCTHIHPEHLEHILKSWRQL